MKRLYCVTMPDGVQYGIPAEYIAHLYAKCPGSSSVEGDGYLKMLECFDTNNPMFKDWCRNHLQWSDVKDYAIVISSEAQMSSEDEYEYGWTDGGKQYLHTISSSDTQVYEQIKGKVKAIEEYEWKRLFLGRSRLDFFIFVISTMTAMMCLTVKLELGILAIILHMICGCIALTMIALAIINMTRFTRLKNHGRI